MAKVDKMKVAVLFSGGKDSNYALSWALKKGHQVSHLVTVYSENQDSFMYQTAGIELTELACQAIGIPQVKVWTSGQKEKEVSDLEDVIARLASDEFLDGIVTGALRSEYQKGRIDDLCRSIGIESLSPVWQKDSEEHLRTVIDEGFDIIIVSVSAEGLDEPWLGRRLDLDSIDDLKLVRDKHGINIDGEGGEFETMVLDAPHYKRSIVIEETKRYWARDSGRLAITKAHLEKRRDISSS